MPSLTTPKSQRMEHRSLAFILLPKANVFVGGGAADVAHPRQFADVQLLVLMGGIVPEKYRRNVLFAHLRPPNLPTFGLGIFRT